MQILTRRCPNPNYYDPNVRAQILRHLIMLCAACVSSISKVVLELFDSFRYAWMFVVRI